jgi:zinc/manganese transport system substrate-binding protein
MPLITTVRAACMLAVLIVAAGPVRAAPLRILAAESVYGQIAGAVAGDRAEVASVLTRPGQDPHDFEPGASTARAVAGADIVILNGAGYDPWMDRLLAASPRQDRQVILVARLLGARPGANPHLWYRPDAAPRVAQAVAAALPADAGVRQRLAAFLAGADALQLRIGALRGRVAGAPVEATEPVFDYMAAALGLAVRNARFQLAVMNGAEPRVSDVAGMEDDLRARRVRALIYNTQVNDPATERLRGIARQAGVPEIGVSETLPQGQTYLGWMQATLDTVASALGGS